MRTSEALIEIKNSNVNNQTKEFIVSKWEPKQLVVSEKYGSKRCPSCNTCITYIGHYCAQCGQKIVLH